MLPAPRAELASSQRCLRHFVAGRAGCRGRSADAIGEAGVRDVDIRAQRLSAAFGANNGPANANSHSHDQRTELPTA